VGFSRTPGYGRGGLVTIRTDFEEILKTARWGDILHFSFPSCDPPIRTKSTKFSKQPEPLIRTEILPLYVARSGVRTYVSRGVVVQRQSLWSSHVQPSCSTPAVLFFFGMFICSCVWICMFYIKFFIKSNRSVIEHHLFLVTPTQQNS